MDIYIATDNVVTWTGLKDSETDALENAATVTMSLFQKTTHTPSQAAAAVQEVQTLLPDAAASAGNWTLSFEGETTGAIAHNASVATIKTALEALSNIEAGDVVVGGDTLDTSPVSGGMTFTWEGTLGDVSMLEFDLSGLTGPTQAGSTMTETTQGAAKGEMIDEGGGLVGIPVPNHGLLSTDYIRLQGFVDAEYNNVEFSIDSVKKNKIFITATYVAEVFSGAERVYAGVPDGCNINVPYTGTPGQYRGILPDSMGRLRLYDATQTVSSGVASTGQYYLFLSAVKGASKTTKRPLLSGTYDT